jgi:hypothetical protein
LESPLGRPIEGRKTDILCIEALEIFTMFSALNVKRELISDRDKHATDQNVPPLNISEDFALASDRWTKHKLPAQIISDKDGSMD